MWQQSLENPPNYSRQIGKGIAIYETAVDEQAGNNNHGTVTFYELKEEDPDYVWLEYLPGGTVMRHNDEGGKARRDEMEETRQKIEQTVREIRAKRHLLVTSV